MAEVNLESASVPALMELHGAVLEQLKSRGVIRSYNNPGADYAETLFCSAFGWQQAAASKAGYDATDADGTRYQIKCRRLTCENGSRQLGAMRDLEGNRFDVLAAVLFDERYNVHRAALIPHSRLAGPLIRYSKHVRASILLLQDEVWAWEGVEDVTAELARTAQALWQAS